MRRGEHRAPMTSQAERIRWWKNQPKPAPIVFIIRTPAAVDNTPKVVTDPGSGRNNRSVSADGPEAGVEVWLLYWLLWLHVGAGASKRARVSEGRDRRESLRGVCGAKF